MLPVAAGHPARVFRVLTSPLQSGTTAYYCTITHLLLLSSGPPRLHNSDTPIHLLLVGPPNTPSAFTIHALHLFICKLQPLERL